MGDNVIPLQAKRNDLRVAVEAVKKIIYDRSGTITLAEAVGILEIAKLELLEEQKR